MDNPSGQKEMYFLKINTIGSLIVHSLMILINLPFANCVSTQCEPAEIGTNHTIRCSDSDKYPQITWSKNLAGQDSVISTCYRNNQSCIPNETDLFSVKLRAQNQQVESILVIINISIKSSPGKYICAFNTNIDVCPSLELFSKPEVENCSDIQIIDGRNEMQIVCWLSKVYPAANMIFYNKSVACESVTNSNYATCQSNIPLGPVFPAGLNVINAFFYPNVSNGTKYSVNKSLSINLKFPQPVLGEDCAQISTTSKGYIKNGTVSNCTCSVQTQGVPQGTVKWYFSNGTAAESVNNGLSATLQPSFLGKETNLSYKCVGVSILGESNEHKIEYTVKNAYGPEQVLFFTSDNNSQYDICSSDKPISISCSVPKQNVAPEPSVNISVSDGENLVINANDNNMHYIYMSSYKPKTIGNLTLKCVALNSIFKDLNRSAFYTIFIAGPPILPPVLTIGQENYSGTNIKTNEPQKERSDITITCQVSGGLPNTYNMTLSCDGSYNNSATNNDVVKLSIQKVGRQLHGKLCVCKAEHVTPCYVNNTSSVTLNITFPAEVHTFTANSNNSSVTVLNNSDVAFVCDTESNPPATVEIFKTETIKTNTDNVNFTKQMVCEDTGEYFCKAHNSEFINPVQSCVTIYVQCSLQLRNGDNNYKVFTAIKGSDAVIKFDVLGFPPPVSYSLFKNEFEYKYIVTSHSSDSSVIPKYQFEYLPNTLHYGSVRVTIFNLTDVDFTNYSLNINNSIDSELRLSFVLKRGNAQVEDDTGILPAAIGGGIGCFAFVIVIIIIFLVGVNNQQLRKKIKSTRSHQHAEQDHQNSDIYIFKSKNASGMEINYKNYSDVPITITTATALPKNLNVISKPALKHTYFNSIDDYSNEFSVKEADKTHLIQKEIKKNDPAVSYAKDISSYQTNDSDVYANT